jgi:hypothetical protein
MEGVRRGPPNAVRHHGVEKEEEAFNAKVGKEDIFKPTIGNDSSHEISNDNGVVNFATSKNLVVKSTMFPNRSICKYIDLS